jgi:putative lipoic acid-binding regulatory protein
MSKESDFYNKLRESLVETTTFPTKYMFKFIIPTSLDKFKMIETIFDNMGAVIDSKPSKTGKYTSLTILVKMETADGIIIKYQEVSKVEGVISL